MPRACCMHKGVGVLAYVSMCMDAASHLLTYCMVVPPTCRHATVEFPTWLKQKKHTGQNASSHAAVPGEAIAAAAAAAAMPGAGA